MDTLKDLIDRLPPEAEEEVKQFVTATLRKYGRRPRQGLRLDWAGALRDYRDQYTAEDLQKASLRWWDA